MTIREKLQSWARRPEVLSAIARVGLASSALYLYALAWFFVLGIAYFAFSAVLPLVPRKIVEEYGISPPMGFVREQALFILVILVMGLLALPTLHVVYLMTRRLEQRPLTSVGLLMGRQALQEFLGGLVLGLAVASISFLSAYWSGVFQITWSPAPMTPALIGGIFLLALGWFGVAFWEELYFRGYLLQTWASGIGIIPAVLISSLGFGSLHVVTYGMSPLILLDLVFMGVVLAALYLKTRSLWAPIGVHFANNFLVGHILSIPMHDVNLPFRITVNGQPAPLEPLRLLWQTEFVEGKRLADLYSWADVPFNLVFCGLLVLLIWKLPWFRPHPQMEALWQQYVPIAQPWAQLRAWWAKRKNKSADVS